MMAACRDYFCSLFPAASRERSRYALVAVVLLIFVGQGLAAIWFNSQTVDEMPHFAAGYSYWATGRFHLNPVHPPLVKQLCLLPVYLLHRLPLDIESGAWQRGDQHGIGFTMLYESGLSADWLINLARLPNLLLGVFLVALTGWWSYRIWGTSVGVLGLAMAALEPNLVAHSSLVTTDMGWTAFGTATLYALWEYSRTSSLRWLLVVGLAAGLALASKYSAVSLLIVVPATLAVYSLAGGHLRLLGELSPARPGWSSAVYQVLEIGLATLVIACVAMLVLCCVYFAEAIHIKPDWFVTHDKEHFLKSRVKFNVPFEIGTPGDFLQKLKEDFSLL
jgi:hypothetical protein